MEKIADLIKTTLGEIEKILTTKTVVGEPFTFEGKTVIPLVSVGFGFGAGGGQGKGKDKDAEEGFGGGTGGGGGIKPVALLIIDKDGVRVEPIPSGRAKFMEKLGEAIPQVVEKIAQKKQEKKKG